MDAISRFVLTALANAAWQAPVVALVALAGARLAGRAPARYRYAVWVAALALSTLLPIASAWRATADVAPGPAARATTTAPTAGAGTLDAWLRPGPSPERRVPLAPVFGEIVLGCYAVYLVRRTSRFVAAWRRTRSLRASAVAFRAPEPLARAIETCTRGLGVPSTPVLVSWDLAVPATVGALRPAVLLPWFLVVERDELLVAAVGHELAHVGRRDYAAHVACELLAVPFAFHPAVAFIRRKIREARELACDERVTDRLQDALVYARSIVEIARSAPAAVRAGHALGVVDADTLEDRVMRLIENAPRASARAGRLLSLAALAALALTCVAASAFAVTVSGPSAAGQQAAVVGRWNLYIWNDKDARSDKGKDGLPALIVLEADGEKLSGTATVWPVRKTEDGRVVADEDKKSVMKLVDPSFDGRTFHFKVFNGEEYLVGELVLDGDVLRGRWSSSKSKQAGTLEMSRA